MAVTVYLLLYKWLNHRDFFAKLPKLFLQFGHKYTVLLFLSGRYRMTLRADNADIRLTGKGYRAGCVSDKRQSHTQAICDQVSEQLTNKLANQCSLFLTLVL